GPKVLDFGIARAVEGTALTRTGGLMGTPGWIAPEQYAGQEATGRSDMFAWAGLVAFAATGRDPFGRGSVDAVSYRTRNEEPDLDGVPPELLDTVRRAFDKDPGRRPGAIEVLTELTSGWNATQVQPVRDVPATELVPGLLATEWRGVSAPAPRRVRRRGRTPLFAALAVVLVAALVGTWLVVRTGEEREAASGGGVTENGTTTGEGTGTGEEDGGRPTVQTDPENVEAVVAEAIDLALGASSHLGYSMDGSSERGPENPVLYSYTEDPEPRYRQVSHAGPAIYTLLEIGEGPDDVLARTDSNLGTEPVEGDFYRPEDREEEPRADWVTQVESLEQIFGEESQISYQGESAPPANDYADYVIGDFDLSGRTGHHYTGTYVGDSDRSANPEEGAEITFDLWIGDDGYPQHFQTYQGWEGEGVSGTYLDGHSTVVGFLQFNGPVEIPVPDESEIAASEEAARPDMGTS
ncbi:serine/threonine protein kinase, partial [Nocardiopsis halotolerans]|uniref:serine/threonine protein kinase n=1 Tax=Nocardiopsis halotolerans TaxID=124252 RepID=UPI00059511A7